MRLSLSLALFAVALSLAACDSNGGGTETAANTAESAERAKALALMPPFAPLYPDAMVQSSIGTGTGPNPVGTVSFATKASPDEVIGFYRDKATAAMMEETVEDTADVGTTTFTALGADNMGVKVIASPGSGATNVQVIWSRQSLEED